MRRCDIHRELALLGVSAEVHALVDDLELDVGRPTITVRKIILMKHREMYLKPRCRVYVPHYDLPTVQGRLF